MARLMREERSYLDTNVIIGITETQSAMPDGQKGLVDAILNRKLIGVLSEITLAECLVKPIKENDRALIDLYTELFSEDSGLIILPVDRIVLIEAAYVRARHKIKLPDAIHFATAQLSGCSSFITNDHRLANLWGKNAIIWKAL
jgi:predicted nucleic acid-binding protein